MDIRRRFGNRGEKMAEKFLKNLGYKILERQWTSEFGEVDLICIDPNSDIVFVEVKTRRSLTSGHPEDSVTTQKLEHMSRTADCFLRERRWHQKPYRFDVIAITESANHDTEIVHIKAVQLNPHDQLTFGTMFATLLPAGTRRNRRVRLLEA